MDNAEAIERLNRIACKVTWDAEQEPGNFQTKVIEAILAAIQDDPEAFAADVRGWCKALAAHQEADSVETLRTLAVFDVKIAEHLKGQTNDQ